jgi:hypothetical protein
VSARVPSPLPRAMWAAAPAALASLPIPAGKRTMPVRGLRADSDAKAVAQDLAERHPTILAPTIVSQSQARNLSASMPTRFNATAPRSEMGAGSTAQLAHWSPCAFLCAGGAAGLALNRAPAVEEDTV